MQLDHCMITCTELKIIMCAAFVTGVFAFKVGAQVTDKKEDWLMGVEFFAGPAITGMYANEEYKKYGEVKFSYVAGLGYNHSISNRFELNPRVSIERKGFKQSTTAMIPPDYYDDPPSTLEPPVETLLTGDLNNNYLILSCLLRYSINKNSRFHFNLGPYVGKLLKSQITTMDIQHGEVMRKLVLDQDETYKDYDFGLLVSLGYAIHLINSIQIDPQLIYSRGLVNIVDLKPGLTASKNNSLALLIAIKLAKK